MPISKDKPRKRATRAGSRAAKLPERQGGIARFFNTDLPILPDVLRWVLLIAGVAMILGAGIGWPFPTNPRQVLLGLGGGVLVIFAFAGVRRTLGGVAKLLAKLGF